MPCIQRVGRTLSLAAATLLFAACGDSTGNDGSIQLSLSSAGVSVVQGGSGTASLSITRAGGFAGSLNMQVERDDDVVIGRLERSERVLKMTEDRSGRGQRDSAALNLRGRRRDEGLELRRAFRLGHLFERGFGFWRGDLDMLPLLGFAL